MGTLATSVRKEVMDHSAKHAAMPQADSFIFELLTQNPSTADATDHTPMAGLGYVQKEVATNADTNLSPFTVSAQGVLTNKADINWDAAATGNWPAIVGAIIYRKVGASTTRFAVDAFSLTVTTGQTPKIPAGALSLQISAGSI